MSFYGAKTEEAEEQKQLAILEIQRKYAIKRLNNLIANVVYRFDDTHSVARDEGQEQS